MDFKYTFTFRNPSQIVKHNPILITLLFFFFCFDTIINIFGPFCLFQAKIDFLVFLIFPKGETCLFELNLLVRGVLVLN